MFKVFPDPPSKPLVAPAGGRSGVQQFRALAGGSPADLQMFIAVVKLGSGCNPPDGGDPRIFVSAEGGDVVEVKSSFASVFDAHDDRVASVAIQAKGGGVYEITAVHLRADSSWQLEIANDDGQPREFTFVVADGEDDARQPWIELPETLGFQVRTGEQQIQTVQVLNRGTGELEIEDPVGFSPGSGFDLTALPGPLAPNRCGNLSVRFKATQTAGPSSAMYAARTNDTTAQAAKGHNGRLLLSATTLPGDTEVPVFAVDPELTTDYQRRFEEADFVSAMNAVFEEPHPLGSIVFAPGQPTPKSPTALQQVEGSLQAAFPDPVYTHVTYFTVAGDPEVEALEIREARRKALRVATSTADNPSSIKGLPSDTCKGIPQAAFAVARQHGVTQSAMMVVQLVPPPIIDDIDWNNDQPRNSFVLTGSNLVFHPGDDVNVFFSASSLHPSHEVQESPVDGTCPIIGQTKPEQIVALMPEFDREVTIDVGLDRSDNAETFAPRSLEVHLI